MAGSATAALQLRPASPTEEPLGKRARAKREKRARILQAAREIFAEKGFTAATTQEISARAGIGAGTLFLYASTKEELLMAAFVGDVSEVAAQAEATMPADAPVLDQLMHVYGALIDYHQALGASLSAVLLKELMYGPGPDWARGDDRALRVEAMVDDILGRGRARRELRAGIDPKETADTLFSVFHWQLSHWALGRLPLEGFKERLRYRLSLCIKGVAR